eukprot:4988170-Amphidinium_carterae.1
MGIARTRESSCFTSAAGTRCRNQLAVIAKQCGGTNAPKLTRHDVNNVHTHTSVGARSSCGHTSLHS